MVVPVDQILSMAPDASSAEAAGKLRAPSKWNGVGRNAEALWGECKGSSVYQVQVDLSDMGYKCSCPSRKFPCKHVLGLLLLWSERPRTAKEEASPEWVQAWLERRRASKESKQNRQDPPKENTVKPVDAVGQAKRAAQRDRRVAAGLEQLELWLRDVVRNGIAALETKSFSFWDKQAAALVDAQARGVGGRVRQLSGWVGSGRDWPARLAGQLGRLALLVEAYKRLDRLGDALKEDVRAAIGWALKETELAEVGAKVTDRWAIVSQQVGDEDQVRAQRNWLVGASTGRRALVLQFAPPGQGFAHALLPATQIEAELVFYPSACPQRARIVEIHGCEEISALPGFPAFDPFLEDVAQAMARQPWMENFLGVFEQVIPVRVEGGGWYLLDVRGRALPLRGKDHWMASALSGGRPILMVGEWSGYDLHPMGAFVHGRYHVF